MDNRAFLKLIGFLDAIPAIAGNISHGSETDSWWVKFSIDINHELAWHTVQELGFVLNSLSLKDKLPTSFYPVSPPPYLNGGPDDYLSWVIACHDPNLRPGTCAEWLKGRLPDPVDNLEQWQID